MAQSNNELRDASNVMHTEFDPKNFFAEFALEEQKVCAEIEAYKNGVRENEQRDAQLEQEDEELEKQLQELEAAMKRSAETVTSDPQTKLNQARLMVHLAAELRARCEASIPILDRRQQERENRVKVCAALRVKIDRLIEKCKKGREILDEQCKQVIEDFNGEEECGSRNCARTINKVGATMDNVIPLLLDMSTTEIAEGLAAKYRH
ncbi:hypothetical protein OPT61_g7830 [Boeremia exigua]|uniref:Uncharacterized protein n=1 Tax=Boeremia exigua TaxID=749465 RepID=A0ACC2I1A3_9PLEO|nr:hypothetical protein OPT61_g7830 [Boeremia exigua]